MNMYKHKLIYFPFIFNQYQFYKSIYSKSIIGNFEPNYTKIVCINIDHIHSISRSS